MGAAAPTNPLAAVKRSESCSSATLLDQIGFLRDMLGIVVNRECHETMRGHIPRGFAARRP